MLDGQEAENGSAALNLTGGFYNTGDNIQGRTYALTLLSCSVVDIRVKSEAVGELDHARS